MRKRSFLITLVLTSCATSPTGRDQLIVFPDSTMNSQGASAFRQMKRRTPVERNSRINAYVRCVALPLTRIARDDTGVRSWEVVVFRDRSANAFALPGGKIGVHTGLLKVAKTQHQLAAVLGHEVGHVIARHGNERVSHAFTANVGLQAASAAMGKNENRGLVMAALGVGAQFGVLLPFSRTHESEADLIGLELMAKAGFDPQGSMQLWQNMARTGGGQPPEFMSTHPSHRTRIDTLKSRIPQVMPFYQAAQERPRCQL